MAIEKGRSLEHFALAEPSVDAIQLEYTLDFCFAVQDLMDAEGINRKQLAKRMHKSPSALTRILRGDANITLRTLAEFQKALGLHVEISAKKPVTDGRTEQYSIPCEESSSGWGMATTDSIVQRAGVM